MSNHPRWLKISLTGLLLFVVYLATAGLSADHQNVDTQAAGIAAWRLATHGDANLEAFEDFAWIDPLADGRVVANRYAGVVLSTAPFYLVLGTDAGPTVFPGAVAAAFWTSLAMIVLFLVLDQLVPSRTAALAVGLVAFGTATWTASADQPWTHGPAQLGIAVGMLGLATRRWWISGLGFGFSIAHRAQLAVIPLIVGLTEGWRQRNFRIVLGVGVGSAVGLAVLLAYNRWVFGSWSPFGGYQAYATRITDPGESQVFTGFPEALLGTLVSPQRGVFVLMPFLLLLIPGVVAGWRVAPSWAQTCALAGIGALVIQLWVNYFTGGFFFYGSRLTLETLTLCAPLLVLAWQQWTSQTRLRRVVFVVLAGYSVGSHALAAIGYWTPPGTGPWETFMLLDAWYAASLWRGVLTVVLVSAGVVYAVRLAWREQPASEVQQPV